METSTMSVYVPKIKLLTQLYILTCGPCNISKENHFRQSLGKRCKNITGEKDPPYSRISVDPVGPIKVSYFLGSKLVKKIHFLAIMDLFTGGVEAIVIDNLSPPCINLALLQLQAMKNITIKTVYSDNFSSFQYLKKNPPANMRVMGIKDDIIEKIEFLPNLSYNKSSNLVERRIGDIKRYLGQLHTNIENKSLPILTCQQFQAVLHIICGMINNIPIQ